MCVCVQHLWFQRELIFRSDKSRWFFIAFSNFPLNFARKTKLAARAMTHIVRSRKLKSFILCFEEIINLHIFVQNQNNNLLHTTLRKVANIAWDCTFVAKKAGYFLHLRTISFYRELNRYRSNISIAIYNIEVDWNIND